MLKEKGFIVDITAKMEDYLEAISIIQNHDEGVRVKDLADYLNIQPPSVVDMIKNLKKLDLVTQENRGNILLTSQGLKIARITIKKHNLLKDFFQKVLGVDPKTAEIDACEVEHLLSKKTIQKLSAYMQYLQNNKKDLLDWTK